MSLVVIYYVGYTPTIFSQPPQLPVTHETGINILRMVIVSA